MQVLSLGGGPWKHKLRSEEYEEGKVKATNGIVEQALLCVSRT